MFEKIGKKIKGLNPFASNERQKAPSNSSEPSLSDLSDEIFFDATETNEPEDLDAMPAAIDFKRHEWRNNSKPSIGINKVTRKFLENSQEYIEGRWSIEGNLEELHSFELIEHNATIYVRKQNVGFLCTLDQEEFLARVQFNMNSIASGSSLRNIKRHLLRNMSINRIICDKKLDDLKLSEENLIKVLRLRGNTTTTNINHAEDIFQILKSRSASVENIEGNNLFSSDLKDAVEKIKRSRKALTNRGIFIGHANRDQARDTINALQNVCSEVIKQHRDTLYGVYPWKISNSDYSKFDCLESAKVLHLGKQDLQLFTDLCELVKDPLMLSFVKDTWKKFLATVDQLSPRKTLREAAPLTNPALLFIFKSFLDIISEFTRKSNVSIEKLLLKTSDDIWSISTGDISSESSSPLTVSLEQQLRIVFKLMLHFAPGSSTNRKKIEYNFKVLKNCSSNDHTKMIWPCILDAAIEGLLPKDETGKRMFSRLLDGYTTFAFTSTSNESLRVVTHSTAKFIVQISSYLSDKAVSDDVRKVLELQINTINRSIQENNFGPFRDLIEVYNEYWDKRQNVINMIKELTLQFSYKTFQQRCEEIKRKLIKIVISAHEQFGSTPNLIDCLRSFNDFLTDLNDVDFSWIVKWQNSVDSACLSEMNKSKQSYKVTDPAKFISNFSGTVEPPRHYIMEVIQELVDIVNQLFLKDWRKDDVLNAGSELICAIRKSLIYLREQANYESFENFKEVSVLPFSCTLQNSSSCTEFIKNIGTIGESFWYLRKQDEISIDKALAMYQSLNNGTSTDKLRECYNLYQEEFQRLLKITAKDSWDSKLLKITLEVQTLKNSSSLKNIAKLDSPAKYEIIPKLVAGLSAVWSIHESRELLKIEKLLKPHCIQIICVFLLLGLDSDKPMCKQLAQILTGQGKSLVLGLLSSVLALTGNKVRMVCYSEYLAKRDHSDFKDFFKKFNVDDQIVYGTFEELANEILNPMVDGKKTSLRELVQKRILNHEGKAAGKIAQVNVNQTILLIDEVDVFFTDEFYGNYYGACETIGFEGLISIQEKIWQIVKEKILDKEVIFGKIKDFIEETVRNRNTNTMEFHKFYHKPGKYSLLNDDIVITEYTNQSLIDEHLKLMISAAIDVVTGNEHNWYIQKYKLNENEIISYRKTNGIYSSHTFCNYYNTFNYFRLKQTNFDHKSFKNYGYLIIDCGKVSYAKLPKQYPMILGVSGTLTSLNDHEKRALQQEYNINRLSDMPSFFGRSNLEFNEYHNFSCVTSEQDWLTKVYSQTNKQLESQRSVLVFFETDAEIDKFVEKYSSHFERLNVLTENTSDGDKKRFVDDSGLPKTVTVATRSMGRGVDYKSSVTVEKAGGVHVIQTFFSLDIKEETQIKGRTARKNNKGSYELVVCKEHLKRDDFIEDEDGEPSYQRLSEARRKLIDEKGSAVEKKIKQSEEKHNTTWAFYKSFFE